MMRRAVAAAARAAAHAAALLLVTSTLAAQPTTRLLGRVVDLDGNAVSDVRIRIVGHGEAVLTRTGEFSLQLAGQPARVEARTVDGPLEIVYPPAGIVIIPRSSEELVTLVVGLSERELLSDVVTAHMIQLEQALNRSGVRYSASADSISEGLRRIAEVLEIRNTEIEDGLARRRAQNDVIPPLLRTLDRYLLELHDLNEAFTLVAPYAPSSRDALQALQQAMLEYNAAFEQLIEGRSTFTTAISSHWVSSNAAVLQRDLNDVYVQAIDDIHKGYVLPLNESLLVLQLAHSRERPPRARVEQAAADARAAARSLDPRIPVLEQRIRALREALQRS